MKTEYEKCLAGESFIGGKDPKIVETILRTRRLLAQFNATDYADTERKQALLREMFGSLGKGVHVDIDFHCEYGKHIFIGDKVIINMNCTFVDNNRIDIGSNVLLLPMYRYIQPLILPKSVNAWCRIGRKARKYAVHTLCPSR